MSDDVVRLTLEQVIEANLPASSYQWRYRFDPDHGFFKNTVVGKPFGPKWMYLGSSLPQGEDGDWWFHSRQCSCVLCTPDSRPS